MTIIWILIGIYIVSTIFAYFDIRSYLKSEIAEAPDSTHLVYTFFPVANTFYLFYCFFCWLSNQDIVSKIFFIKKDTL